MTQWDLAGHDRSSRSRPFGIATALGTAAHHGFELASGVGLVWQPELGLSGATALWTSQLAGWVALCIRGDDRSEPVLATLAGASLAGVAVHYLIWPWRLGPLGIPVLREAEGLSPRLMPAYNAILDGWAAAALASIIFEERRHWRWAVVGGVCALPVLARSARHHFEWLGQQAVTNPRWWNRSAR